MREALDMPNIRVSFVFAALAFCAVSVSADAAPVEEIVLDNGTLQLTVTPALGGRVLGLRRVGEDNFLKIGEAVRSQPSPAVTADADDIAYLGHDVWVGPQSEWWLHQKVNPARRKARANWPPDPYLGFATTQIVRRTSALLALAGVESPVSGVQLSKRFALSRERADSVELQVDARNVRDQPVAWDLWFNTRVPAATRVFVPISREADVRAQPAGAGFDTPVHAHADGMWVLSATDDPGAQRGKFLLQPAAGWMAGFQGRQVLVIRFAHQPRERIHPEQGQIELYVDAPAGDAASGLLEMEVHAPYRQLAPGASMQAAERWTLLAYDGPDEVAAQRRFLCDQAAALALEGACPLK
jgi:hypothetical protein